MKSIIIGDMACFSEIVSMGGYMSKKYLFVSNQDSISFDDDNWYLNEKIQKKDSENKTLEVNAKEEAEKHTRNLLTKLTNHFENLIVLTAAGTSMDNGVHSGKTRVDLWNTCENEIKKIENKIPNIKDEKFYTGKNIEGLLSYIIMYNKIHADDELTTLQNAIEKIIENACKLQLCESNLHHKAFLDKLVARNLNKPRIQMFTTNYDTLFEQAANNSNIILIDGFSFTFPREFSGRNFDYDIVYREKTRLKSEESFIPKVLHLYKLHGSINWEKYKDKIIQKETTDKPCIIYPASDKYESSYEQPYFEMMSRFQQALRKESTLLLVLGFGFQDKHIQNAIKEAIEQNPNFHMIISYYNKSEGKEETGIEKEVLNFFMINEDKPKTNVTIVFSTFKDFVEMYPINSSYNYDEIGNNNEQANRN